MSGAISGFGESIPATATNRSVAIETKDPDLGLTIAFWLTDFLQEFSSTCPSGKVIIDDEELAGRPARHNTWGTHDFRAWREPQDVIRLACTSDSIVLPSRPHAESVRKLFVKLGMMRDWLPLDHLDIVRWQQRIRRLASAVLPSTRNVETCRFLLRVDDFPSPILSSDDYLRFHDIAAEHKLPYLLAVTPFFGREERRNLSAGEIRILRRCVSEGAELALHGFSHRSRYRNYASELLGMSMELLRKELDRADEYLRGQQLPTIGFVAPYNSYDPLRVAALAERYPLLCGGPESVAALGYRAGPCFLMRSLYVPSYRGAYDIRLSEFGRFDRLVAQAAGLIVPVTLHWANEVREGFRTFRALCGRLDGKTLPWSHLLSRARSVASLQSPR